MMLMISMMRTMTMMMMMVVMTVMPAAAAARVVVAVAVVVALGVGVPKKKHGHSTLSTWAGLRAQDRRRVCVQDVKVDETTLKSRVAVYGSWAAHVGLALGDHFKLQRCTHPNLRPVQTLDLQEDLGKVQVPRCRGHGRAGPIRCEGCCTRGVLDLTYKL